MGGRRTVGQGQSKEKWMGESRGRRADTGRTMKGNGGRRTERSFYFVLVPPANTVDPETTGGYFLGPTSVVILLLLSDL